MRRILKICKTVWTRFGNYPDSPLPGLPLSGSGQECCSAPFFVFRQGRETAALWLSKGRKSRLSRRSRGQRHSGTECVAPHRRCGSKGLGRCPNKQKLGFPATPEIPVSSLCGNKDTACKVVKNLYLAEHLRENQLCEHIVYLLCNLL